MSPLYRYLAIFLVLMHLIGTNFAQKHISHFFEIEKEFPIHGMGMNDLSANWRGCVDGDHLFMCKNVVLRKKRNYDLDVWKINISTSEQQVIHLQLPENPKYNLFSSKYWIYGLYSEGNHLLITSQFIVYDFQLQENGRYELVGQIEVKGADFSYIQDKRIHTVTEVNDFGFKLFRQGRVDGIADSIAAFRLPAAFLTQIGPSHYIRHFQQQLYFLPATEPTIQRFDSDGDLTAQVKLELPEWHPIPEEYMREINRIPYGAERSNHIFYSSRHYSFLMDVLPINPQTFILLYHKPPDDSTQMFTVPVLICTTDEGWNRVQYEECENAFSNGHRFAENEFPLPLVGKNAKLTLSDENRIVQVLLTAEADWSGKTIEEYRKAEDDYFKDHDPIFKVRILRFKGL